MRRSHVSGAREGLRSQAKKPAVDEASPCPISLSSTPFVAMPPSTTAIRGCQGPATRCLEATARRSLTRRAASIEKTSHIGPEDGALTSDTEPPPLSPTAQAHTQSVYERVMASKASILKRPVEEISSTESRSSCPNPSAYRFEVLAGAGVRIHADLSQEAVPLVKKIIGRTPHKDRRPFLLKVAQTFSEECMMLSQMAACEADFVRSLGDLITKLRPGSLISLLNMNWQAELKPATQQQGGTWGVLDAAPASKRQKKTTVLPDAHHKILRDVSPPAGVEGADKLETQVKTPRPDISIGINKMALASALTSHGFSDEWFAADFLDSLQGLNTETKDQPSGPAFTIHPTKCNTNLTFPTLIVEGKGYATGGTLFGAQNQASVSGASGLKLQEMLYNLLHPTANSSGAKTVQDRIPLVFSICLQGSQTELWVHSMSMRAGKRVYLMTLLASFSGIFLEEAERFTVQLDNVLEWTAGRFFDTVVDSLADLAHLQLGP